MYDMPSNCPVCMGGLSAARLLCPQCGTSVEGNFAIDRLSRLSQPQKQFVISFLKCRGNIKEMEKEYSISYPTVRSRLDEIVTALGESPAKEALSRKDILGMLARREITPEEAQQMLQKGDEHGN